MADYRTILSEYYEAQKRRSEWVAEFADKSLSVLDNRLLLNGKLSATGIGSLALHEPVEITPVDFVPDPTNERHVGRFAYGFKMAEGYRIDNTSIPMGPKKLMQIRSNGTLGVNFERYKDHRSRPAYYRALALWPGFFVNLTVDISASEQPPGNFGAEIYLAYRIMPKLIDSKDLGVVDADGKVDKKYLFRRSVNFPDLKLAEAN
jgi:hypothetical protein